MTIGSRKQTLIVPEDPKQLKTFLQLKLNEIDSELALTLKGKGSPEGVVKAPVGTTYQRTDGGSGTSLYIKESGVGNTGWVAVAPGSGGPAFPIGSIFVAVVSTNPSTLLGYGTWSAFGTGRVMVGYDSGDSDFNTVEGTGGEKTHTLTSTEMPAHTHTQDSHNHTQDAHTHTQDAHHHTQNLPSSQTGSQASGTRDTSTTGSTADALSTADATAVNQNATATNQASTATNQNTGGDGAHNNVQPYIVVYMWKRTA
jgi:microcystin-dependent protein